MNYLLVFIGGGLGSVVRYAISGMIKNTSSGSFPLATLISNLSACLVMGIILIAFKDKTQHPDWQILLLTGFCGGFSTFSTFSYETVMLVQNNQYLFAGLNILISVLACFSILYFLIKLS